MQFVAFTEINEWEGEEWRFWLQLDGNEEELKRLKAQLAEYDEDEHQFKLDLTPTLEWEVDALVGHADSGYMSFENKCIGILVVPEITEDNPLHVYYKGDIVKCFTQANQESSAMQPIIPDGGSVYLYVGHTPVYQTYDFADSPDFPVGVDVDKDHNLVGVELLLPHDVQRITVDGKTVWERPT